MIPRSLEKRIIKMTRAGMSEAEIVRQTGLSRKPIRRVMKMARKPLTIRQKLARIIGYPITPDTKTGRCPICHYIVTLPCKWCLTRIYNSLEDDHSVKPMSEVEKYTLNHEIDDTPVEEGFMLDLRPAERKRYEEVRKKHEEKLKQKEDGDQ